MGHPARCACALFDSQPGVADMRSPRRSGAYSQTQVKAGVISRPTALRTRSWHHGGTPLTPSCKAGVVPGSSVDRMRGPGTIGRITSCGWCCVAMDAECRAWCVAEVRCYGTCCRLQLAVVWPWEAENWRAWQCAIGHRSWLSVHMLASMCAPHVWPLGFGAMTCIWGATHGCLHLVHVAGYSKPWDMV